MVGGGFLFWTKTVSLLAPSPFQRLSQRILQDLSGEKGRKEVWMSVLAGIVHKQGVLGARQPLVLGGRKGLGVSCNSAGAQTTYSDLVPISTPTYRGEVEYLSQTADLLGV